MNEVFLLPCQDDPSDLRSEELPFPVKGEVGRVPTH